MKGKIKRYSIKDVYGFIAADGVEGDIFFHLNDFLPEISAADIEAGGIVEFELKKTKKGYFAKSQIKGVRVIDFLPPAALG